MIRTLEVSLPSPAAHSTATTNYFIDCHSHTSVQICNRMRYRRQRTDHYWPNVRSSSSHKQTVASNSLLLFLLLLLPLRSRYYTRSSCPAHYLLYLRCGSLTSFPLPYVSLFVLHSLSPRVRAPHVLQWRTHTKRRFCTHFATVCLIKGSFIILDRAMQ
jgi:hypothetical protein